MANKKSINITQYKRKRQLNIGIFIFAIVFIYLIVAIIMYASSKNITTYEVREGSILKDNSYTGLVIRDEVVIPAEASGYINYFQNEYSKMKAGSDVYAITSDKITYDESEVSESSSLSAEDQLQFAARVQGFNESYRPAKFSSVYSLQDELTNSLLESSNNSKTTQIDSMIKTTHPDATVFPTQTDGILFLHIDGCESLTLDSFTAEDFDRSNYQSISRKDNAQVEAGEPAYKLIRSENWSVMIELSDEAATELAKTTVINTRINKDTSTIWADFSIIQKDGKKFGRLDYDDSMIRYAGDRFVNIELIMEDESGLKIPKSSVVENDFYQIPMEYLTIGGNSNDYGVMVENKKEQITFQPVTIYKETKEGTVYIGTKDFKKDTVIIKPDNPSSKTTLSETSPLQGVYNVNKGYAVFKQVTILTESDDYYIVQLGDKYGIHNYDHIVQNGDMVEENEVVFQ